MRQGSGARRGRGRGSSNRKPNRNQSFDSNGPSVRIRGTAAQLQEKYLSLARDASSAGDRVMAENYFQHADHYYRILAAQQAPQDVPPQQQPYQHQSDRSDDLDGEDEGQPFNGRDQRRAQNGQIRDADPRVRAGTSGDGQPPLDEGLHRMLGGDAAADDGDSERRPHAQQAAADDGAEATDGSAEATGDADATGGAEPAPRRRRRRAAPQAKPEGEPSSTDAAE